MRTSQKDLCLPLKQQENKGYDCLRVNSVSVCTVSQSCGKTFNIVAFYTCQIKGFFIDFENTWRVSPFHNWHTHL